MPTNTMVVSALQAQPVPPDRECPGSTTTQILQSVVDFVTVETITQEVGGNPTGDSVAQQALQVANLALQTAQAAQAAIPQKRSLDAPVSIPTGNSALPLTWSPAMPDTNYEVRGTYYGTAAFPGTNPTFHVEDGTRTVNGCTIRLNDTPADFKFAWVVEALGN